MPRSPSPTSRLGFLFRQLSYDLEGRLLGRPAAFVLGFAALALGITAVEARLGPEADRWRSLLFPMEESTAQAVLATLAGSMISVISVVYSILLVALTLASTQFSPRILAGFVRDRVSRTTLGLFVGTFVYCLLVLRTIRGGESPFVPSIGISVALGLALFSLAALIYFIDHIVHAIQANHIVDRIATETEGIVDAVFGPPLRPGEEPDPPFQPAQPAGGLPVLATAGGYVQGIHAEGLRALATQGWSIHVARPVGSFVVAGSPLAWVIPGTAAPPALEAAVRSAFDLGPVRTLQQDVEFGFRQIVDIALKAISPAINDPSTAITCIDHLGRLLVRVAPLQTPTHRLEIGDGEVRIPDTGHVDLIDLAFEQIRQYGRADMAVALRLLRTMAEVARATPHALGRHALLRHVTQVEAGARAAHAPEDCEELSRRAQLAFEAIGI